MRRHRPDTGDALGWVGLLYLIALIAMGLGLLQAGSVPQGFAP